MPTPSEIHGVDEALHAADLVVTFRGKDAFIVKDREGPSSKGPISIEAAIFRITQHRADLTGEKKVKRSEKTAKKRCGDQAAVTRMFMNGIRGVLGQEELYPEGERSEEERFYITPIQPQDGRISPRRITL